MYFSTFYPPTQTLPLGGGGLASSLLTTSPLPKLSFDGEVSAFLRRVGVTFWERRRGARDG